MAKELTHSYWDVNDEGAINNSTESYEFVDYDPNNLTVNVNTRDVEIQHKDIDSYILASNSYLEIGGKILKVNGAALEADDVIAVTNNGYNLIRRAQHLISGVPFEDVNYVGETTLIKGLTEFSEDYVRSNGTNMGWVMDTGAGGATGAEFTTAAATNSTGADAIQAFTSRTADYNGGFKARYDKRTQRLTFLLPLKHLFGTMENTPVTRGVRHTLKLTLSDQNDILFRSSATDRAFHFDRVKWWVPIVKPSLLTGHEVEETYRLNKRLPFKWDSLSTYRSDASTGISRVWRITTQSQRPKHVFVALKHVAKENDQSANNMTFDNCDVSRIHLRVNSRQYPMKEFEPNFTAGDEDYSREYMALLGYKDENVDSGIQVSYETFGSLYPVYFFDLSNMDPSVFGSSGSADISVHITHRNAPANHYVYATIVSEREARIDATGGSMTITQV